jgi:ABC-2 type transport system ATP-binding protein
MTQPALEINKVTKTFLRTERKRKPGRPVWKPRKRVLKTVVDQVSFRVERGEIFGLLGPNGSGKSTLIRIIATLLLPDSGSVTVFGHDVVRDASEVRKLINRVSPDAAFFKKLSAMENLVHTARLHGVELSSVEQKIREILSRLRLPSARLHESLQQLSRGMQQKVAIARAFLTSPVLLLLDEPTTGLDPKSKREVQAFIRSLRTQHDATILLSTHDMSEADELSDRILILDRGKGIAVGSPSELKESCASDGKSPSLEDVFILLTGRELEEEEEEPEAAPGREEITSEAPA